MEPKQRSSEIDLFTLFIAAVASAAAAYLTSKIWARGALISAAMTPVIVALIKEALARPVDKITTVRQRTTEEPRLTLDEAPPAIPEEEPRMIVYRGPGHKWKLAIVTGLAAFAIVVAVFTIPELIAGSSAGRGGDSATTFFGGESRKIRREKRREQKAPAPAETPDNSGNEQEESETPAPEETPTEAPTEAPTPTPTAVPTVAETPVP